LGSIINTIESHPRFSRWSGCLCKVPIVGRLWQHLCDNPKELDRFVKFAIVGIVGAAVDFTILNIMKLVFEDLGLGVGWGPRVNPHSVQLVAANAISFTVAVLSNFTWNRLWTFPESRLRPLGSQLGQFAVVNVLGLGINTVLLLVMDQYVFQHFVGARLSYNLAKAFAIGVVLFWNFSVNRIWTYRGIK
jgi:putative flippase GtrA